MQSSCYFVCIHCRHLSNERPAFVESPCSKFVGYFLKGYTLDIERSNMTAFDEDHVELLLIFSSIWRLQSRIAANNLLRLSHYTIDCKLDAVIMLFCLYPLQASFE